MLRTALAFIKKDFLMTVSYKFNFVVQMALLFVFVAGCYLIGKFVGIGSIPLLKPYGGNYFGFLLIGVAFAHYVTTSIHSFAGNIRDGQLTGTLEFILVSPTRLSTFLISSSLWSYLFTSLLILFYLLMGVFFFDLSIGNANLLSAFVIITLSIVCFASVGIIFATIVLLFKKGDSIFNVIGGVSLVVSGLWFPPEVFPSWVGKLSAYIPTTYLLHGLRLAVLQGYSVSSLISDIKALLIFTALFFTISICVFPWAVKRAKTKGTLIQY